MGSAISREVTWKEWYMNFIYGDDQNKAENIPDWRNRSREIYGDDQRGKLPTKETFQIRQIPMSLLSFSIYTRKNNKNDRSKESN